MEEITPKLTVGDIFGYALAYLCWIATAAAGMLCIFQTRNAINVLWPAAGGSRWVLRAIDRFGLLLMGLIWLVYVIFVEQHYRSSITFVRERRLKAKTSHNARSMQPPQGRTMKILGRLGLDVLAARFLPTLFLPLLWFVITYLLQQLGFSLISR